MSLNGRKVTFKEYQNKEGNRQVRWDTIFEIMRAKAKIALECEEKAVIYARQKVDVESVFGTSRAIGRSAVFR